jgi:hypothetical protein
MTDRIPLDNLTSDQLDALYARIATLEHVAAGNKRHVQLIVPDLERAEAALTRVRALHRKASHGDTCVYCAHGQRLGYDTTWPCDTIRALDQPAPGPTAWTPPPPGDRREQLPDHILALLDIPAYTSTACETAELLAAAATRRPEHAAELRMWEDRQRQRCRINNKFTGVHCQHTTPGPAATQATDDMRLVQAAKNVARYTDSYQWYGPEAGPSVAECAGNDRRWPLEKEGE